jgi:hypothetical protein
MKSKCAECGKAFVKNKGARFCSARCQGRNWYKRFREKARAIALAWYYRNRKRRLEVNRAYAKTHPRNREWANELARLWYAKNRDRVLAQMRARYRKKRGGKVREYRRKQQEATNGSQ